MTNWKKYLRAALYGGLGYGIGLVAGSLFSSFIFDSGILAPARDAGVKTAITVAPNEIAARLLIGIAVVVLIVALGGAIGGAIGGFALSFVNPYITRWGITWRSALSFGITYIVILFPVIFVVALFSFYSPAETAPNGLMTLLSLIGLVIGVISGLILGLLSVIRHTWRVLLASVVGFMLGGVFFGYGIWAYYFNEGFRAGAYWELLLAMFAFGAFGGAFLGMAFVWIADKQAEEGDVLRYVEPEEQSFSAFVKRFLRSKWAIVSLAVICAGAFLISRILFILTPEQADISNILISDTRGTHWTEALNLSENLFGVAGNVVQPDVAAGENGESAVVWSQNSADESNIYYAFRKWDEQTGKYWWSEPVNVSNSRLGDTFNPQIVIDSLDRVHIVWAEESTSEQRAGGIFYSRCVEQQCTEAVALSHMSNLDCTAAVADLNTTPTLAIDNADTLMAVWSAGQSQLPFSVWQAGDNPPTSSNGCVAGNGDAIAIQPRVTSEAEGSFALTFVKTAAGENGDIHLTRYNAGRWDTSPQKIGEGRFPEVIAAGADRSAVVWCDANEQISYWASDGVIRTGDNPACNSRPAAAREANGLFRFVWYSSEVENVLGAVNTNNIVYESALTQDGWRPPTVVARSSGPTQPALAFGPDGVSHLAWSGIDGQEGLIYTTHTEYDCANAELNQTAQAIFDVQTAGVYRPGDEKLPYCKNKYEELIFLPNPDPAFSDAAPTVNGGFDKFAELVVDAEYEVVFSTMWYDKDTTGNSPGRVLADSIAVLYQKVKEHPEDYPRGMTVRILLNNPPEFTLAKFITQLWNVFNDLKAAGVPEMRNSDIGWNLEVANYAGAWPHGHTKIMVVDGRTAVTVGFNMSYPHYPLEHPSGLGRGRTDLGIQITGPVAQETLKSFDDQWKGSTNIYCANFQPNATFFWLFSCSPTKSAVRHVPEVLLYYTPEADSNAFSLYRSSEFLEADDTIEQALASAQKSIDVVHVNFTLELVCDLNLLFDVCDFDNSLPFMFAMMDAVENNGAKVRILVEEGPIEGVENKIAIEAFKNELDARGLSDQVEMRFFPGETHMKAALIDEELVIIGSQNYHYSAWGTQGLTEYSLATDDPQATQDFKRMYDYYWEQGTPVKLDE